MKPIVFSAEQSRSAQCNLFPNYRDLIKFSFHDVYSMACYHGKWYEGYGHALEDIPPYLVDWYAQEIAQPPYKPGDIVYVKEPWTIVSDILGDTPGPVYMADFTASELKELRKRHFRWHSATTMPEDAARLYLRVLAIQRERLQNITKASAILCGSNTDDPIEDYAKRWDKAHRSKGLLFWGWDANPWIWSLEFEKLSKEDALSRQQPHG